jgi:ketosteroid isomerase-like protein
MPINDEDIAQLTRDVEAAAVAFIRGDMRTYLSLIRHAEDYTLLPPFGGGAHRGFDHSEEAVEAMANQFQGGEATLELIRSYVSGDLAVLVAIERQHGLVLDLPDQDWSLRVTLVFRRHEDGWQLAHRHADPLTHPVEHGLVAALARGEPVG